MSSKNLQETNDNWTFVYVKPVEGTLDDIRQGHDKSLEIRTTHADLGRDPGDGWCWVSTFLEPPTMDDISVSIEMFKYRLTHGGRFIPAQGAQ